LATPNYSYEKRQRELAKKRKKEDKLKRKTSDDRPAGAEPAEGSEPGQAPVGEGGPAGGTPG
jgi:hypothetical protein